MWHVSASLGFIELTEMNLHDKWTIRIPGSSFLSSHRSTESTCFTGRHFTKKQYIIYTQCFLKRKSYFVFNSLEGKFAKSGKSHRKMLLGNVKVLHFNLSASWAESPWTPKVPHTQNQIWTIRIKKFFFFHIHDYPLFNLYPQMYKDRHTVC